MLETTFDALGLSPQSLSAVRALGFTTPSPVQSAAIPPALEGRDVLASAKTGTGKTAAFGLPLIERLAKQPRGKTRALILAPTRELAAQICQHLHELSKGTGLRIAAVFGGVGFRPQIAAFQRGVDIIVACPGRLVDLMAQGHARLGDVEVLVLDEADRMMDMGFLPVVRRVVKALPKERQTLFFSATLGNDIVALAKEMTFKPVHIDLTPREAKATAVTAAGITHTAYSVSTESKTDLLIELLQRDGTIYSAIAFTRTKHRADRVAAKLEKAGIAVDRIHGDRSQGQRVRALDSFKRGRLRVLVATDVAARGIDISELGHVVNYDVPLAPEDYVHRVGRTARAEATGDAVTFISRDEEPLFSAIEKAVGRRINRAETPKLPPPMQPIAGGHAGQSRHPAAHVSRRPAPIAARRGPSSARTRGR